MSGSLAEDEGLEPSSPKGGGFQDLEKRRNLNKNNEWFLPNSNSYKPLSDHTLSYFSAFVRTNICHLSVT